MAEFETLFDKDIISNASKTVGINEDGIDSLAIETMNVAKTVNDFLNSFINVFDSTKSYYKCESADKLRNKFNEFSSCFSIFIHNIENYAYSLKKVKNNYSSQQDLVVKTLNDAIANFEGRK